MPLEHFVALLKMHGVSAVADVRSAPYSRFTPDFNRERLSKTLEARGLKYLFFGEELGGRPKDASCYCDGRVDYVRMATKDWFNRGLERLIHNSEEDQVALLCAEQDPVACHRMLLVSRVLAERDVEISHIHSSGVLEAHSSAETRLLRLAGLPEGDLFRDRVDLLREAYQIQSLKAAYVAPKVDPSMESH